MPYPQLSTDRTHNTKKQEKYKHQIYRHGVEFDHDNVRPVNINGKLH